MEEGDAPERPSPMKVMHDSLAEDDFAPKRNKRGKKAEWGQGQCSVCGTHGEVINAGAFLGSTFGSWQELTRYNTTSRLCESCLWAFKDPRLLRSPVWTTLDEAEMLSWGEASRRLMTESIDGNVAVVLPHGGRKIVAPYAEWGHVAGDSGVIKWGPQHRKALVACAQLNKVGIRGQLLSSPKVPFQQFSQQDSKRQEVLYQMWDYLKFVRDDKTLSSMFVKLSMNMGGAKS